ncbi:MAG: hypothetical protein FWD19_04490, partial [Defluviitaleaceae bacterium]|nr:hypothetical protein [Defluviitaleaceae bacterium]
MSDYKTFHVGGGGNCVFFSTAKQLNADVHKNIRQEISQMYENELTREIIKDAAKNLIENQFKAGFANTALNWELHDYNFKGEDASDKIIQKLTTENSEINDMLALRLLTQVKSGNTKDYLG